MTKRWSYLPLLLTQGVWVRFRTPRMAPASGEPGGVTGEGPRVELLVLGDSIAVGVGVEHVGQALPARLAAALAARGRSVRWRVLGRNGARSHDLAGLAQSMPAGAAIPDLVVVSNGINDVTSLLGEPQVLARLQNAIVALEGRFPMACIAQLGLPPLGAFPALPQPLRRVLGERARGLDQALQAWLAPRPRSFHLAFGRLPEPREFAQDGYHPGAAAVVEWADSLADSLFQHTLHPLRESRCATGSGSSQVPGMGAK